MSSVDVRQNESKGPRNTSNSHDPVSGAVDWILGILAGIFGLVQAAVGVLFYTRIDQEAIREAIVEEDVEPNGITQDEMITAAEPFTDWLAIGFGVTGLALLCAGVAFIYKRRQTRRRVAREGGTTATFLSCSVYGGAVASMISSIIPGLGALIGGGIGAHLYDSGSSVRLGAVAGLVSLAIALPLLVCIGAGVIAGGAAIGEAGSGAALAGVVAVSGLLAMAFSAGLGALGGYIADRLD